MSTLFWLARYDLRAQLRDRGMWLLLAGFLVSIIFAAWQSGQFVRITAATVAAAEAQQVAAREAARRHAEQYFANPSSAENAALRAFRNAADIRGYAFREYLGYATKPLLPGAGLAIAEADVLPAYVRVRTDSLDSALASFELEHPARLALGRFDPLFVLLYLWPLVLLAFTASILTEDRERKRLDSLHIQGVTVRGLLFAQVVGRTAFMTVAFIVAMSASAWAFGSVAAGAPGWYALLEWAGAATVISVFWAAVATVIVALSRNRTIAVFAGFGAWTVLVILIPAALAAAIAADSPVPSRESYIVAMRDAGDRVNADRIGMLERFYDAHPEWRPQKTALAKVPAAVSRIPRAIEMERAMRDSEKNFADARQRQQQLFERWKLLSPTTAAYGWLATLSGNDSVRHSAFLAEINRHHQALRSYFQERIQRAALQDEIQPCAATCARGYGFTDFDSVPRFAASGELKSNSRDAMSPWLLLAWALFLSLVAAWILHTRSEPQRQPQILLPQA